MTFFDGKSVQFVLKSHLFVKHSLHYNKYFGLHVKRCSLLSSVPGVGNCHFICARGWGIGHQVKKKRQSPGCARGGHGNSRK